VGYCFGIRSERRLCEEVRLNLAYRWFCRLDLDDAIPDHSTFSKNRHGRFRQSDAFRLVFEAVLLRCMKEGLVRGEGFAIDASVIKADANRVRGVPSAEAGAWPGGETPSRAVREYLEAIEQANPVDDSDDEPPATPPKNISLTDPAARWTAAPGGPAFFAYSTNYLIDLEAGVIVDVNQDDGGSGRKTLRAQARAPGRRHRLRSRANARLDGRGQGHSASRAGVGPQ